MARGNEAFRKAIYSITRVKEKMVIQQSRVPTSTTSTMMINRGGERESERENEKVSRLECSVSVLLHETCTQTELKWTKKRAQVLAMRGTASPSRMCSWTKFSDFCLIS